MANSSKPTESDGNEKPELGAVGVAERRGKSSGRGANRASRDGHESPGRSSRGAGGRGKSSFFDIYKPGQGYYTRLCTAIGGGILILGLGNFLVENLYFDSDAQWTLWLQYGIPAVVVVALGLVLYWVTGVNRTACDFFIATEGEMKKVSWSDRNELVGSTKVVIACTMLLGLLLAAVDLVFIQFFKWIDVLRSG